MTSKNLQASYHENGDSKNLVTTTVTSWVYCFSLNIHRITLLKIRNVWQASPIPNGIDLQ